MCSIFRILIVLYSTFAISQVHAKPYEGIVRYDLLGYYSQSWDCPENARVLTDCQGGYRVIRILERNREGYLSAIWIAQPYGQSPTVSPEYIIDVTEYVEPVLGAQRLTYVFKMQNNPGKTLKNSTWTTFTVVRDENHYIVGIQHPEYGFFQKNHVFNQ